MAEIDHDRVERIATEVRAFLEPLWAERHAPSGPPPGKPVSHNMCRFSAAFLKRVLDVEMPEGDWCVIGGNPTDGDDIDPEYGLPGGCRDPEGRWHAHYWLITGDYGLIVDVTADQFGGEPVICTGDDSDHRENYFDGAVRDHLEDVKWTVGQWLAQWQTGHAPGWSAEEPVDGWAPPGPG